jgi:hypothetical protein
VSARRRHPVHKCQMMETLGLRSSGELIQFAIKHELVEL